MWAECVEQLTYDDYRTACVALVGPGIWVAQFRMFTAACVEKKVDNAHLLALCTRLPLNRFTRPLGPDLSSALEHNIQVAAMLLGESATGVVPMAIAGIALRALCRSVRFDQSLPDDSRQNVREALRGVLSARGTKA